MKFRRNTTERMKFGVQALAVFVVLSWAVMLRPSFAYAQSEVDPDHFDSPNTEPVPPRTAENNVTELHYDGTFSLPYGVLCHGKKLAPGKYSISIHFDGKVGQATLSQKGHVIEIAAVVPTDVPTQHDKRDEVVVVENNKKEPTLSVVRVAGFSFAFDPKLRADPSPDHKTAHAEKVLLTVIVPNEIANRAPSVASPKP